MKPALLPLLLPALLLGRELDFELLGPEAYRLDNVRLESTLEAEDGEGRLPSVALESGMGITLGAASAVAVVLPLALMTLDSDPTPLKYTAAGINVLGATAGIWLGGRWTGRSGSPAAAFAGALLGQVAGIAAGALIYDALEYHPLDEPLSLTVTLALPTVLGVLGYNLTDR